ncbi:MAG TPA: hypothetical protein VMM55_09320 [Thermohalobaculum sp.]|nr:hypothetical protein [Thermohalobaculum sp.]
MSKTSGRIGAVLGRGGGTAADRLKAQVDRVQRELSGLAEALGDTLDGERIVRRVESVGEHTADEVARRARQAADTAREHPVGTGFAVVVVVGLLALLLSRR